MRKILTVITGLWLFAQSLTAVDVTCAWDPNPEPDVQGYILYWGTESGNYVGNVTTTNTEATATGLLPGTTYYFTVTAFNVYGESAPAEEINYTTPGQGFVAQTLFPTNLTSTNVVIQGRVADLAGTFGAFFEWSEGTNLNLVSPNVLLPSPHLFTDVADVTIQATLPIGRTNYTYRLVVTNAVARFEAAPQTISTQVPKPVRIRFKVEIIQTAQLGPQADWDAVEVAEVVIPYPENGGDSRFYQARMAYDIEYEIEPAGTATFSPASARIRLPETP